MTAFSWQVVWIAPERSRDESAGFGDARRPVAAPHGARSRRVHGTRSRSTRGRYRHGATCSQDRGERCSALGRGADRPERHVPGQTFPAGDWWKLGVVALIFGLINAYIKPIAEAISLPARILTLGLFSLVINALLLLLLALVSDALSLGFKLAKFPPNLSLNALVAALLCSIVISIVSMVLAHFLPDRSSWRSRLHL